VYHLKQNPTITYYGTKYKIRSIYATYSPSLTYDTQVKVTLAARPLLTPDVQMFAGANLVYSQTEYVFILLLQF
jgi:hypothetical protein